MSGRSLILIVLLIILCAALIIYSASAQADSGVTEPGNQIMPRESLPTDDAPAQPGEGPDGLPTPTVG